MKMIKALLLVVSTSLLVSCFGNNEEPEIPEATPIAAPEPPKPNPRPDRPPPPPQKQDGSMIVKPGGTVSVPDSIPEVSESETDEALSAAEAEVRKRKAAAADGDDPVSEALKGVSEEDLNRAFTELKKAVDGAPKGSE